MDDEAAGAGGDVRQVDRGAKAARLAEHHIAAAGWGEFGRSGPRRRPNDQVVEAVAVDVAGRRHRVAGEVVRPLAVDDEAAGAGGDGRRGRSRRQSRPPCRTPRSCRRHARVLPGPSAPGAPMIRSSKPSPLMSPADATERPEKSSASSPWMTKPPVPFATSTRSIAMLVSRTDPRPPYCNVAANAERSYVAYLRCRNNYY